MTFDNVFWSDVVGYIGLGCWFVVMTPQIYANWKLKNASSLSPGYVILNLVGNLFSCAGSILGGLIFTSILVTGYLSLLGFVLLYQLWLYQLPEDDIANHIEWQVVKEDAPNPDKHRASSISIRKSFLPAYEPVLSYDSKRLSSISGPGTAGDWNNFSSSDLPPNAIQNYSETTPLVMPTIGSYDGSFRSHHSHHSRSASVISGRSSIISQQLIPNPATGTNNRISTLPRSTRSTASSMHRMSIMSTFTYPPTAPPPTPEAQSKAIIAGGVALLVFLVSLLVVSPPPEDFLKPILVPQTLGWLSGFLSTSGRLAQLHKNFSRKSVEGLSILMFFISILGNINYMLALVLFSVEPDYLLYNLPWLACSGLGLSLDMVTVGQFFLYSENAIPYDALPSGDSDETYLDSHRNSAYA